jgi:hypothetical protein
MATPLESPATSHRFDDRNICWHKFGDFEGFVFAMFDVDEKRNVVDMILKFEPNSQIFPHRHLALTNTLVVEGEHRIYEADGKAIKEVRATGTYTSSPPGDAHREGGGAEGCVVFYSVRGEDDRLFDVLDDELNVVGTLRTQDFKDALEEQTDPN